MTEELLAKIDIEKRTTRGRSCPRCGGKIIPSIRAVYPNVLVAPFLTIAATDARHYRDVSSGTYRFLPIHQADATTLMHGVNEYVTVDGYAQAIRFYATLIETLGR